MARALWFFLLLVMLVVVVVDLEECLTD